MAANIVLSVLEVALYQATGTEVGDFTQIYRFARRRCGYRATVIGNNQ
jgi:hypothetical protein